MDLSTPIFSMPVPAVKDGEARIGVAICTFADQCTLLLWEVFGNALEAGLKRAGIEIISHGSYFSKTVSVSEFTVSWESRSAAVEAIKKTLQELNLLFRSIIALESADQVWHTLQSSAIHPTQFDKVFLKPEDIAAGRREFDQAVVERQQVARIVIDSCKAKLAELEGGNGSQAQ